jgi:DNA-binding CsgD family transcriptional regulator/PAS domain-containing protein
LTRIADRLGAGATTLTITEIRHTPPTSWIIAPRTDPVWFDTYRDHWAASNPLRDRACETTLGEIYGFNSLGMSRKAFDGTEFYNEFLAPQHLDDGLFMVALRETAAVGGIGFYRSRRQGPFEAEHEGLLDCLAAHLRRAVVMTLRLARVEMQRDSMVETLNASEDGAILVDAQARVLFANLAAERILSTSKALRTTGGRLAAREPSATARLRALISAGTSGEARSKLVLPGPGGGRLSIDVAPITIETSWLRTPPAAIVFISGAKKLPSVKDIQSLFGVTPAQAALANALLNGGGIPAAAERLKISRSTARSHLFALFQKTGTNRQSELVRAILQEDLA